MLGVVAEELTDGASRVRGQELERSGIGCSGCDDNGVLHAVSVVEETHDV